MKLIPLTHGLFAKVDDSNYDQLIKYNWNATKYGNTFYACRTNNENINGKLIRTHIKMHRQIIGITDKNILIDHKDTDGLNNQEFNLRECSHSQNQCNRRPRGTSKYLGVCWHKQRLKWSATIKKNQKCKYLGIYDSEIDAALAYDKAAKELHGEFANLNFPESSVTTEPLKIS